MAQDNTLILDISVHENTLKMGILLKEEYSVPVRRYSERIVAFGEIERLVSDIVRVLNSAQRDGLSLDEAAFYELRQSGQLLYDYLLTRQVKDRLSEYKSAHLIVSVDEKLADIPWELLYDGSSFLSLKFNMGRAIRTGSIDTNPRYRTLNNTLKMLILSDPTCDLKSAYEEGVAIKDYLGNNKNQISVDFKSRNIDRVYLKKNLRDYDIVHYAGHCQYDANDPASSGWLLSDGVLSAKDFMVMGEALPLPSIIFANACQSAPSLPFMHIHANRQMYSLAQTLLFSGVRHYIGTLWKIGDGAGFLLAKKFYSRIKKGFSLGEALRLARIESAEKYGSSSIFWANYILYGDPSFVLFQRKANPISRFNIKRYLNVRKIIACALSAALLITGLFLSRYLYSLHPSSYVLFSGASKYFLAGENQKAIDLSNRIIEADPLFLSAYKMLGDTYFRIGDFDLARLSYFEYARNSEKKNDKKNSAAAYIKIAWAHHMLGDYPKAREFYDKSLVVSVKNNDKLNEADALERLAVWYIDKGDHEKAFALLMRSCEINRSRQNNREHRFNLACDYFSIGYLYFDKDENSTAKEFFNKSKDIFKSLKAIPELSDYYFDMGEIALFEKNYHEAQEFYAKGLELDKKLNDRFRLSSDYQMLGELCLNMEKFSEAQGFFYEAVSICREIGNKPTLAGTYYDLAGMYQTMGQVSRAREYFEKSLEIYKHIDTPDYQKVYQEYLALD